MKDRTVCDNGFKVEQKTFTKTRKELADKYFGYLCDGFLVSDDIYANSNMGIVSLLSNIQHIGNTPYGNEILNDIKCVLINDKKSLV